MKRAKSIDPKMEITERITFENAHAGRIIMRAKGIQIKLEIIPIAVSAIAYGTRGRISMLINGDRNEIAPKCHNTIGIVQTLATSEATNDSLIPKRSGKKLHRSFHFGTR